MSKDRFTSRTAGDSSQRSSGTEGSDRRGSADRRLIVVSNREPYRAVEEDDETTVWKRTTGGLVSALDPVMRQRRGTWIAWEPGEEGEFTRSSVPGEEPSFTLLQVPVSQDEVEEYYEGFANRALWPLCHYFVDRCHFDEEQWRAYERINERFADALAEEARGGELVWIHDYHFFLLPRLARERRVDAPIAFFLHIPFPAPEIFQIFPWGRRLLAGLLGADQIGFHCSSYALHFLACCRRFLGAEVSFEAGTVRWRGRTVRVAAFPIGIEATEFVERARDPEIVARGREIRDSLAVEKVILGVDRLDYTKGIPSRLRAVDALFERHPEHLRRVSFVQVAVPSRSEVAEYREIKRRIDELVGRINGRHGDAEWQPIRYANEGLERDELVAHYLAADVGLVTPLRDGMNLVALEFCACRTGGDGVLVLSELAGAAERLADSALLVNPYAVHEVADALHEALTMSPEEQARRMRTARRLVLEQDVGHWLDSVLDAVAEGVETWAA
jgi:trehalose 6-phosphate synthase